MGGRAGRDENDYNLQYCALAWGNPTTTVVSAPHPPGLFLGVDGAALPSPRHIEHRLGQHHDADHVTEDTDVYAPLQRRRQPPLAGQHQRRDDVERDVYKRQGQGIANFATGFFGGMGGCAMIGQSVINVKSGGSTRLSTFVAGAFLLFLIVALGPLVARIPMPALVAVMIMVSIGTFSWRSLRDLRTHPWQSSVVMLATVVVVVLTHDLARGVLVGVLLSGCLLYTSRCV